MSDIRNNVRGEAKKPYARPEIVKHGNVETLTQGRRHDGECPSKPFGDFNWD
jgi:hypothetical protein